MNKYKYFANFMATTEIDVNVAELMDNLSDEELKEYCDGRICEECKNEKVEYDIKEMVEDYFHGDLDLHKLFKKLGKKTVLKILEEC